MPKSTFLNLPQEKKDKLFAAARKEFARTSFEEASINKIIQEAGISRGSFYTYFEDKKDLVSCLLSGYTEQIGEIGRESLKESNGDVFALFLKLFDFTMEYSTFKDDMAIFRNLSMSLRNDGERNLHELFAGQKIKVHPEELLSLINTENLNIQGKEDLRDLLAILFPVLKSSTGQALRNIDNLPKIRKSFLNKLKMIQYGVKKERNTPNDQDI